MTPDRPGRVASSLARGAVALLALALCAQTPSTGVWDTATQLPYARSEVAVTTDGTTIYVIGGYAPAGPNPTVLDSTGHADVDEPLVEAYDSATHRWSERAPLPKGLNHVAAVALNGKVYTFGGFAQQNRGAVTDANVYDPAADAWAALPPLPYALGSIGIAVLDGKIHLIGGRDTRSVATHTVFDPATGRYSTAAPLPVGRDHLGVVAAGGKLYAIAGRVDDFDHNTSYVDAYDPAANRWSSRAPMPSMRSGMAVALYRGRIFAIGGERGGGTFTNNEAYDPAANVWAVFAPLPEGRHGTGAAVIGDALYLPAGGPVNGGSRQSDTMYVFRAP